MSAAVVEAGEGKQSIAIMAPAIGAAHAREEARVAGACRFPCTLMRATRPQHAAACISKTFRLEGMTEQKISLLAGLGI